MFSFTIQINCFMCMIPTTSIFLVTERFQYPQLKVPNKSQTRTDPWFYHLILPFKFKHCIKYSSQISIHGSGFVPTTNRLHWYQTLSDEMHFYWFWLARFLWNWFWICVVELEEQAMISFCTKTILSLFREEKFWNPEGN